MREKRDHAEIGHRNWTHSWSTGTKAGIRPKTIRNPAVKPPSRDGHSKPAGTVHAN